VSSRRGFLPETEMNDVESGRHRFRKLLARPCRRNPPRSLSNSPVNQFPRDVPSTINATATINRDSESNVSSSESGRVFHTGAGLTDTIDEIKAINYRCKSAGTP